MNKEEMRQKLGNITQIRDLLFGDQMEEYELQFKESQQKIQHLESKLEELNLNLERFKSDIKEHLSQLKNTISQEIKVSEDALGKKLKYLSVNTYTEVNKLKQNIEDKAQDANQKIDLVNKSLNLEVNNLKKESSQNKESLEKDLENLKQQLSEAIEKNLSELSDVKVSRSDLAEVLFELCLKVKGQDIIPNEIENNSNNLNGVDGDLLLLEEQNHQ